MPPSANISSLIRRGGCRSVGCSAATRTVFPQVLRPPFSTQTLTSSQPSITAGPAVDDRPSPRKKVDPYLLVPSQRDPTYFSLFGLRKYTEKKQLRNFLKFQRGVELPETAAWDKNFCIGSSDGLLFFMSTADAAAAADADAAAAPPPDVFAFDPLTGVRLPLPPSTTLRPLPLPGRYPYHPRHESKALLSPSHRIVVLNRILSADFAPLGGVGHGGDGEPRWTPLPDNFRYAHDFAFHKGLLHAVDRRRNLGAFSFDDPSLSSAASLPGDQPPLRCHDDHFFHSWLAESPDGKHLFLVRRHLDVYSHEPFFFKVFRRTRTGRNWTRVDSIGDLAIFVGVSHQSMCLSAPDFPDSLIPNSIYFTESRKMARLQGPSAPRCTGVFSLDTECSDLFEETLDKDDVVRQPPRSPHLWFTPSIAAF